MQAQPISRIRARGAVLEPWQQSLVDARDVVKAVLGRAASTVVAERESGIYRGVIIGETRDYVIQQIGRQASAVIHAKEQFRAAQLPEVGRRLSIHYSRSHAFAREIRQRSRQEELSR
jgi:hypothetical protein